MKGNTIVRRVLLVFTGLLIGLYLYGWNAGHLVGNTLPMPFGYGIAAVLSGSMEPALSVDDLILVRDTGDYEIGDIVVFQEGSELVVHRIVAVDGETVQTKGEANRDPDTPIGIGDIKGEVTASVPGLGAVVRAVKKPAVGILILAAAVLLTELSYRKERKNDDEEIEKLKEEIRRLKEEQE